MTQKQQQEIGRWIIAFMGAVFLLALLIVGGGLSCQSASTSFQGAVEDLPLPAHGDPNLLKNVQSLPDEGREHVWPDIPVQYKTMPPTSGPHFPDPTAPGFYTERPAYGYLVHSLEHGSVVIYYNPTKFTSDVEKSLKAFVKANSGHEAGVIAVPSTDFKSPFILTAWDKKLELNNYDAQVVRDFLAEYLGRGPEIQLR